MILALKVPSPTDWTTLDTGTPDCYRCMIREKYSNRLLCKSAALKYSDTVTAQSSAQWIKRRRSFLMARSQERGIYNET